MDMTRNDGRILSTTILAVRRNGQTAIGGDGQVTLGNMMIKAAARKVRSLADGKVKVGFAGSAADAFALLERFEKKLSEATSPEPQSRWRRNGGPTGRSGVWKAP